MKNPIEIFDISFITRHTELLNIPEYISINNITKSKRYVSDDSLTGEATYQYKYDHDGYPVWRISNTTYDTIFFEYEDL